MDSLSVLAEQSLIVTSFCHIKILVEAFLTSFLIVLDFGLSVLPSVEKLVFLLCKLVKCLLVLLYSLLIELNQLFDILTDRMC